MNTTTNVTAFNITELTAGVKYTFRVTAVAGDEMTEGKNISVSLFTSKMKFKLSGLLFRNSFLQRSVFDIFELQNSWS
jgi:hypothetical protein